MSYRRYLPYLLVFLTALPPSSAIAEDESGGEPPADQESATADEGPSDDESTEEEDPWADLAPEFSFGSYGRVQYDYDFEGNRGRDTNVVAHGPRILEGSYAELDFRSSFEAPDGFTAEVLTTIALLEPFAHFSGDFVDQSLAVRNLYLTVEGFIPGAEGFGAWAGSRMYRGDDIYLLDWWPLDELNTVGGGVFWESNGFQARAHLGVNRLDDDFQFQTIEVPGESFGSRQKVVMERQRSIGSLRLRYEEANAFGQTGAKAVAYGEYHAIPSGQRIDPEVIKNGAPQYPTEEVTDQLPSERGVVAGAQLGLFGFGPSSHLNLFFRWARGLAAYGEFGVPFGRSADGTSWQAEELLGALSANWETEHFGLMGGGYLRSFRDADSDPSDIDDFTEGAVSLRPIWFATRHFHQAVEVSWQSRSPRGLTPEDGEHRTPSVLQASVLEIIGLDQGSYRRPQLRLQYTVSISNEDARELYPSGDQRRPAAVEHFVGLGAEWWFNSSRY